MARVVEPEQCRRLAERRARAAVTRARSARWSEPRRIPARSSRRSPTWPGARAASCSTNCHGVMHTVGPELRAAGRRHAREPHELPAAEQRPGLPGRLRARPRDRRGARHRHRRPAARPLRSAATRAPATSATAAPTGWGTPSCASTRTSSGPALALCTALGPRAAPDCAQGAYHDYWFAAIGADDATLPDEAVTDPRRLCGAQPAGFVGHAGTGPSSTTARGRRDRFAGRPRRPLRRARRPPARGMHHRGIRDRAAGPGRAAPDLRRPDRPLGCRELRARNQGAEPARLPDLHPRRSHQPLRGVHRRAPRGLLPLARQDTRRADRREVRPLGLSRASGRRERDSCAEPAREPWTTRWSRSAEPVRFEARARGREAPCCGSTPPLWTT